MAPGEDHQASQAPIGHQSLCQVQHHHQDYSLGSGTAAAAPLANWHNQTVSFLLVPGTRGGPPSFPNANPPPSEERTPGLQSQFRAVGLFDKLWRTTIPARKLGVYTGTLMGSINLVEKQYTARHDNTPLSIYQNTPLSCRRAGKE